MNQQTTARTVLVCGGRNYRDMQAVWSKLDALHASAPIGLVVHGAASGADTLAEKWAVTHDIRHRPFKPHWDEYGIAAGPIRNREMLIEGKPDLVLAFPGGRGTADMIRQATERGVPVERCEDHG